MCTIVLILEMLMSMRNSRSIPLVLEIIGNHTIDFAGRLQERDDGTENQQDQDAFSLPPGYIMYYRSSVIALLVDQWFFIPSSNLALIGGWDM